MELVPYIDLKDILELEKDTIASYPALRVIQASVFDAFEDELGRSFEVIERTETFYPTERPIKYLQLPGIPVASVTSITADGDALDSTEYHIFEGGVRLLSPRTETTLVVVYTGGLSTVPKGIKRAALIQTCYEFQNKNNIGASTVKSEGGTVSVPSLNLLPVVREILDSHKHPLVMT